MQNKSNQVLIAGGCEVMTKLLPEFFFRKGFATTLLLPEGIQCQKNENGHIKRLNFNSLKENHSLVNAKAYDYLIISGESRELDGEDLQNLTRFLLTHTQIKYKIGFVSQSSANENASFEKPLALLEAEKLLKAKSNSYLIFKPSLYMELLGFFIRGNQVTLIKEQQNPVHWVSGEDVAHSLIDYMVDPTEINKSVYIYGPEKYNFEDALTIISSLMDKKMRFDAISIAMLKSFARFSNNDRMVHISDLLEYYSNFQENDSYRYEKDAKLQRTSTCLEKWSKEYIKNHLS